MDGRIDLDRARREAKRLLRAARAGDEAALGRMAAAAAEPLRLADAQRAVARELGEASWPRLVRRAEAEAVAREDRARQLVVEATSERRDHAEALLALDPNLARESVDAALVLGDAERVRAALARDPGLATRVTGAREWLPLLYPCHSAFLGGDRTGGLVDCTRALLEAGADPDSSWEHPEFGSLGALYGAAGVAHEPRMTALLLEAGADPNDDESVYHATETADDTCLRLLLGAGARVEGTNAIAHVLDTERPAMLRLLLDHEPGSEVPRSLLWAVYRERSPEVLRMLVAAGADPNAYDKQNERTPYGLAWRMGRPDLCELLAELGARREIGPIDELIGLAFAGDRDGAQRLAAADPARAERLRRDFFEALHQAAAEGRRAAVEILLELGVRMDRPGQMGGTPLHHAAWWGHGDVVEVLLARGSDPAAEADGGATPLGWTAHGSFHSPGPVAGGGTEHLRIAEMLVAEGATVLPEMVHEAAGELAEWLQERLELGEGAASGEASWAEREHAAHAIYLASLPTADAEYIELGMGFAVRTGLDSNRENGVVSDEGDVAEVTAWLRGVPAQWLISAQSDLHDRLVAAGWRPERTAVVMGARPADLQLGAPEGEAAATDEYEAIAHAVGFDPIAAGAHTRYVARRDGRPVAIASTFGTGDTTVVLELAVLPEHRRQGIGRALMARALEGAAEHVVLGPTPDSIPFYRALGFQLRPALRDRCFYSPPS
jgi:ankyrin repeat protein/GNAT superfamily N-acetyltransferase